ncbi:hypothetical protein MMC31_002118 [Peltigera leucophlebia]|nr:hypothetical protein [Peltigera leucophlebia]
MSSSANPISPAHFSSAIKDLPLGNLHSSAAELRNSIAHLRSSNEQLRPFAEGDDADEDCADAIKENEEVIERMEGRIEMLKAEVEARGYRWVEPGEQNERPVVVNGHVNGDTNGAGEEEEDEEGGQEVDNSAGRNGATRTDTITIPGGGVVDAQLWRLMEERLLGHPPSGRGLDL